MQKIGGRTEFYRKGESLYLIIKGTVEIWKKVSIGIWWLAWITCGVIIIKELGKIQDRDLKLFLYAFLSFWAFYVYRIGKVLVWRLYGQEFILVDPEKITIKKAIKKYGKAQSYFLENIDGLAEVKTSPTAFFTFMENSFWTIGAETLQFKYLGKYVRFGIQLPQDDYKRIHQFLAAEIKKKKTRLKKTQSSETQS